MENAQRGKELLERELKTRQGESFKPVADIVPVMNRVARDANYNNSDDLLAAIGSGAIGQSMVAQKICAALSMPASADSAKLAAIPPVPQKQGFGEKDADIIVEGASGITVTLARCCKPVPGDSIVGFSTKVRGITVHRENCPRVEEASNELIIPVSWGNTAKKKYEGRIMVDALDRSGLFADVAQVCANAEVNITSVKASQLGSGNSRMKMDIMVRDLEQLYSVIAKLNAIKDVIDVYRG